MAEATTIASPYAEALFKSALSRQTLTTWFDMLRNLANIASQDQIKSLNGNPGVSAGQLADLYISICKNKLSDEARNLVQLMAENKRLAILPQVSEMFEKLKAQHEGVLEAKIVSAYEMKNTQLKQLVADLEKKFKHKINAKVSVDPELIGGVIVEIGDEVLDNSVRGKLEFMAVALKS
jgi:F-type H+-transporting ATPase subunit delta